MTPETLKVIVENPNAFDAFNSYMFHKWVSLGVDALLISALIGVLVCFIKWVKENDK